MKARVTLYSVDKCGYYKSGSDNPKFCTLLDTLNELKEWNTKKTVGETCTYEINDRENIYRTFCLSLITDISQKNYLLTTWNEVPSVNGQVASVNRTSMVGQAEIDLTDIPEENIPGYATYFWFIPNENIFATIQFHHQVNGHQNMVQYINSFLSKFTKHVISQQSSNPIKFDILGYALNQTDRPQHLNPQFKTSILPKPGKIEFIKNNVENIRKIIRKDTVTLETKEEARLLGGLFSKIGLVDPAIREERIPVKYEINFSPSINELNIIIDTWDNNHSGKWDDIGFMLEGDNKIYWLSHSLPRDDFELNISKDNDEVINAESLLAALTQKRHPILKLHNEKD